MKKLIGEVVLSKMAKTAVIEVKTWYLHPVYKKRTKRTKRYKAHNEIGAKEGETVELIETRPISKEKRWKIVRVLGSSD